MNSVVTSLSVDTSGNSLTSTAFSGLTYFPGGAVETANLAIDPTSNIPGITLTRTYDNRGRITLENDENSQKQSAYKYSVSYDGNGNVTGFNDSVAGAWTVKNDALHRLSSSTGTVNGVAASFQETYDHFGNRNVEYYTYKGVQNQPSPYLNFTAAGNNRINYGSYDCTAKNAPYDCAGNLLSDGLNNYLYDAENRLCAVQQATTGGEVIGYLYAPDGTRLGKGNITKTFSCDMTKNGMLTGNILALTNLYTVGPNGEQLEEVGTGNNYNYLHFNVFWEGKLLGTYTGSTYAESNWHFALNDWLGSKRQITTSAGAPSTSFFSGPFGDYLSQNVSGADQTEQHFTGKERDIESGLDYFPARYFNSNSGRFMSPDWTAEPDPVPWAELENPQTLNLYAYVQNNPVSRTDLFGHADDPCEGVSNCVSVTAAEEQGPDLIPLLRAGGHHFVDQSLIRAKGAWDSLSGQVLRRWSTGKLPNPGLHKGFTTAHRLNSQQIAKIINDLEAKNGPMAKWNEGEINEAIEAVQGADGDVGSFLTHIAEQNPLARTVQADVQDVWNGANAAMNRIQSSQAVQAVEGAAEEVEAACDGGPACIP